MLLQPFLEQARHHPEILALNEGKRTLRYGELLGKAEAVALALAALGVGSGHRAAVFLDRGIDAVVAVFGILLAGACYVPLDVRNPPARSRFIVGDGAVSAVLGLGPAPAYLDHWPWLDLDDCGPSENRPAAFTPPESAPAAILYTSGSTGKPKGVVLSHGAIAAFARWAAERAELQRADRIASSAPLFFDLSTFDLYGVLGAGASLHFLPASLTLAPAQLAAWLGDQAISGWYTVPSLLSFLAYKGNLPLSPLPDLRFLFFAGEVFPLPALQKLATALPETKLYNFYGPTETNVCCAWPVERARLEGGDPIPIGLPAAGDELRVDPDSGELLARGPTLLSGYWNDGQLTAAVDDGGWYRSGDRVSINERGEYVFHERLGRMLKCSGYRVEPAEIEAAIRAIPGVEGCAVVGLPDPTAGERPAVALILRESLSISEVRRSLRASLPGYMQPFRFRPVDELPRLPNGKLDYGRVRSLLEQEP